MLTRDDWFFFVDDALDGMIAIVEDLGDELANTRPDLPGANSPYALLTHCLGVVEWWAGHLVAGRPVQRDRDSEFRATGSVADLVTRARAVRARLADDVAAADPSAPLRNPGDPEDDHLPFNQRQGAALLHVFEELAQHRGQMELTRDVLRARGGDR